MSGRKCQSSMVTTETTSSSGGVTSVDVLEVDELTVNSRLNLSKAAAKTTNFGEFQVEENRMQLDPESSYNSLNFSAPNIVLDGNVSILGVASTIRQTDIQTTSIQMFDNVATIGELNTQDKDKGIHCVYYDETTVTSVHDFFGTTKNLRVSDNVPIFTFLSRVNNISKPEIELVDEDKIYSDTFYKTFQANIIGDAEFSKVYMNTMHCNNHQFINEDKLTLTNGTNKFEVDFGNQTVESIPEIIIFSYPTYAKLPTLTFKNTVTSTPDYFDPLKSVDMNTTSGVIDFGTTVNFSRIGSGQETSETNLGKLSVLVKNNSNYKEFRFESDGFINTQNLNVDSLLICNNGINIKGKKYRVSHITSGGTVELTELLLRLNPTHNLTAGDSTFIMIEEFTPVKYFNNNIYKAIYEDTEYIKVFLPISELNLPYPVPYSAVNYTYNVYFVDSKEEQNLISGTKFNKGRILTQQDYKLSYNKEFNLLPGKLNLLNNKNEGILIENTNNCLKITSKKSTFFLNSSKKPYFQIIEKPKNYQQTNIYEDEAHTSSSSPLTTTTGVYIPQYVVDSAHTHNGDEISTVDNTSTTNSKTLISKTKLLLFIESQENYQQITNVVETEDSIVIIEDEKYDTNKVPYLGFNETLVNYQMVENSISQQVQSTVEKINTEVQETKTKLVLFNEIQNNYQQVKVEDTNNTIETRTTLENSKFDINKTKLVLFDGIQNNYQQVKVEDTNNNNETNSLLENSKLDRNKTKLVLFDNKTDNYLQIKVENNNLINDEVNDSTIVSNNNISKNFVLKFNIDNSLTSYDLSKNLIFNETTLKNTLNVERVNITSDISLKKNIKPLKLSLDVMDKVNSYEYNFINSNKKVYGVIAQEIEKVLPNLISQDLNIKRVDYTQFTPILVNCVKDLKQENIVLKEKVSKLENKIDKIMSLLENKLL